MGWSAWRPAGEEAEARAAHATYFLAFAERTAPLLRGVDATAGLAQLEREFANLRAALAWFDQMGIGEAMLRLAAALGIFWSENCHWVEGNAWLERATAIDPRPSPARAWALAGLGENAGYLGDIVRAETALQEGIVLARSARRNRLCRVHAADPRRAADRSWRLPGW